MLAAASASTLTPERATALVAVGLAVSGAILGGMAFARAKRVVTGGRRLMAAAALILGGCGLLLGGRVIVAALGTEIVDEQGVELLRDWIDGM